MLFLRPVGGSYVIFIPLKYIEEGKLDEEVVVSHNL